MTSKTEALSPIVRGPHGFPSMTNLSSYMEESASATPTVPPQGPPSPIAGTSPQGPRMPFVAFKRQECPLWSTAARSVQVHQDFQQRLPVNPPQDPVGRTKCVCSDIFTTQS